MPTPHGLDVDDQTERFLLRYSATEASFLRRRASELRTSINMALRTLIQDAMPPEDPRGAAIAAIEAHLDECTLCTPKTVHTQCTEGRKLKRAYDATVGAPPEPKKRAAPTGGRRSLGKRGLVPGLEPVEPVPGQMEMETDQ